MGNSTPRLTAENKSASKLVLAAKTNSDSGSCALTTVLFRLGCGLGNVYLISGSGTTTTPSTPTVDASALSIKTNVGTTLPKDGNGNFDCTIKSSETIRLSVSGTDAAATWAVADASVLSISADGLITPAKVGTTTVTATVGGAVLAITVRIK